jgi:hypothetical protein
MAETETLYRGECHCVAIGYAFRTRKPPSTWTVRACQCSFCRAHAVMTTSDPDGTLEFVTRDAGALHRYRFGLHTADFLICRNCGVYIGALMRGAQGRFGIINLHTLRVPVVELSASSPRDYGGEDAGSRNARRERQWTPIIGEGP